VKDKVSPYDLLEERIRNIRENIVHQERENERRLDILNGEGDRIKEILKESIPREIFDRTLDSMRMRIAAVEAAQIKAEGRHQLTQYVPWIIAAAAIAVDYFKK
jgi:hypothetical protein